MVSCSRINIRFDFTGGQDAHAGRGLQEDREAAPAAFFFGKHVFRKLNELLLVLVFQEGIEQDSVTWNGRLREGCSRAGTCVPQGSTSLAALSRCLPHKQEEACQRLCGDNDGNDVDSPGALRCDQECCVTGSERGGGIVSKVRVGLYSIHGTRVSANFAGCGLRDQLLFW